MVSPRLWTGEFEAVENSVAILYSPSIAAKSKPVKILKFQYIVSPCIIGELEPVQTFLRHCTSPSTAAKAKPVKY